MTDSSYIDDVITTATHGRLWEAIDKLLSFSVGNDYGSYIRPALDDIIDDYRRMEGYWADGYHDAQLPRHFMQLAGRIMALARAAQAECRRRRDPQWMPLVAADAKAWRMEGVAPVQARLESDMMEMGMLSLEPDHTAEPKRAQMLEAHYQFMAALVRHIVISRPWTYSEAAAWSEMMTSPTLDGADLAVITSAVSLALMAAYDGQKLALLSFIYTRTADETVRQRALVGMALASVADENPDMDVYGTIAGQIGDDQKTIDRFEADLCAVQTQLFYAAATMRDAQTIQQEIMPDLARYSMKSMRQAGESPADAPDDDEAMRSIIDPDADEREMETVEQRFTQMMDMQKQGSDIYFGGFSQMKRFPFFATIDSWITPFTAYHPQVRQAIAATGHRELVEQLVQNMSFCDSDKYSFVFALARVFNRLPPAMLEMMSHAKALCVGGAEGQAAMGLGLISPEQAAQPAYIRRNYLQDLYRFFRLWPGRAMFRDPFSETDAGRYIFLAHGGWAHSPMHRHFCKLAAGLVRTKRYAEALLLLEAYPKTAEQTYELHMLTAQSLMATGRGDKADSHIAAALAMRPDDRTAMACAARRAFQTGHYKQAAEHYAKLLEATPDNYAYQLCLATCQANLGQTDEALKAAYRLDYEHPDTIAVRRLLAWALTRAGQYDKADEIYAQLTAADPADPQDLLSHGLCKWAAGSPRAASAMIGQYLRRVCREDSQAARRARFNDDIIRANHDFLDHSQIVAEETEMMAAMAC